MQPTNTSQLEAFFRQHGIRDVECIFADISGYPRGKLMPAHEQMERSASSRAPAGRCLEALGL